MTAIRLYELGYDVHWFPETAESSAQAEIITASNHRNIEEIAMFGYSLGGWKLRNIASNVPAAVRNKIVWTGYVDAIRIHALPPFTIAERRKPPGSPKHYNQYQLNALLHGNVTDADLEGITPENHDRSADVDPNAFGGDDHVRIDFTRAIQDFNQQQIEAVVTDR